MMPGKLIGVYSLFHSVAHFVNLGKHFITAADRDPVVFRGSDLIPGFFLYRRSDFSGQLHSAPLTCLFYV